MIKNYLLSAIRSLKKNVAFTIINLGGLSLGLACFILILQYVTFEKSVNTFHTHLPDIYRVLQETKEGKIYDYTPPTLAGKAQRLEKVAMVSRVAEGVANGTVILNEPGHEQQAFNETHSVYADGEFFKMFSLTSVDGSASALSSQNKVALSQTTSLRYFNKVSSIGKTLVLNNDFGKTIYTVSYVFQDFPANSDLNYDLIFSLSTLSNKANLNGNDWANLDGSSSFLTTWVELKDASDYHGVARNLDREFKRADKDITETILLQPAVNLHLSASLSDRLPVYGNLGFIYLLTGISYLILVIAWLNFFNLSTAVSLKRLKEVGVRKIAGADRSQIILQFLGESILINGLALVLSVCIVNTIQPLFNNIIGKPLSFLVLVNNFHWATILLVVMIGSLSTGLFSAIGLSSIRPLQSIKGIVAKSKITEWIRKPMVTFQFCISAVLISSTLIIYKQIDYLQTMDKGIVTSELMIINGPQVGRDSTYAFRNESFKGKIRSFPAVQQLSSSGGVPSGGYNYSTEGITKSAPAPGSEKVSYNILEIDNNFLDTYEAKLLAGVNFTENECRLKYSQRDQLIVNENASRQLGFDTPQSAIGETITWSGRRYKIVGVVKDYHHENFRQAIAPIIFFPSFNSHRFTVKIHNKDLQQQVAKLKEIYQEYFPGNPFEYSFVDEDFDRLFKSERNYGSVLTASAGVAILIACMGLLGLSAFTVKQRSKEIGIRKVLGATIGQITTMVSRDFLILVFISFFISLPISSLYMNQWLAEFSYHTTIGWTTFALTFIILAIVSFLTVGSQAVREALVSPTKSLKSE